MNEQKDKPDPNEKTDFKNKPQKSVMTYRAGLEVALYLGIPVLVIALILKLTGC
jgi:hypothetical protein